MLKALRRAAERERSNICPVAGGAQNAAEHALLLGLDRRGLIAWDNPDPRYGYTGSGAPRINAAGRAAIAAAEPQPMTEQVKAFALWSSRGKWFGGVLYATREDAEQALADFNYDGRSSVSLYDGVIELNGEVEKRQARKATDLTWLVTETDPYGKTIGWRWKMTEEEANTTAAVWRSQSAGKVEVRQVEVEA
jgi:hypothetical protein